MSKLNIEYLQLVTRHQAAICGYIRSIAPGLNVDDVLQETNIVLWEKADTFQRGTNFKAFAFRIAHFKTLEALRRQKRDHWPGRITTRSLPTSMVAVLLRSST